MFESNKSFNHLGIQLNTSPQRKSILYRHYSPIFPTLYLSSDSYWSFGYSYFNNDFVFVLTS